MKRYYVTVEADRLAAFQVTLVATDPTAHAVEHERLPACPVIGRYCCRPPRVLGEATEKVVLAVRTALPRRQFRRLPGLVRVRTTPTYSRTHPGVTVC